MELVENLLKILSEEDKEALAMRLLADAQQSKASIKLLESGINNSVCPHCGSNQIYKYGKNNGKSQKFYCKHCKHYFTIQTNTVFANTKKPLRMWCKYIDLMGKKLSLREIAKEMQINLKTAFLWRHKILSALTSIKQETLSGIVEADETYFRESQKGNRNLTRKAHKSGKSKLNKMQIMSVYGYSEEEYKQQKHKRGLSKDLVCVITATNRTNNIYGKTVGYGKVQPEWIVNNLQDKIQPDSTLVTDGEQSYILLKNVKHKRFMTGLSKSKTYNLGRIDNIHTSMKGLINHNFKGVATKYLDNYVNYVNYVKALRQSTNIFEKLLVTLCPTTLDSLRYKVAF